MASTPPATPDDEANWDAAYEAAQSQSAIALTAPLPVTPSAAQPPKTPQLQPALTQPAQTRSSAPVVKHSAIGSRIALLLAAAALLGGALYFIRSKPEPPPQPLVQKPAAEVVPGEQATPPLPAHETVTATSAPAVSQNAAEATAPKAAEPDKKPSDAPAAVEPAPSSGELVVVTVTAIPPDARFYYKGKAVGRSPFRVELKPGERRAFEIGRPGYFSRKVVVDGKKKEFTVTMRPESPN